MNLFGSKFECFILLPKLNVSDYYSAWFMIWFGFFFSYLGL